ncbi:MAG: hypothetical protein C4520_14780 [Candidatus Abyssobacteria bacterium SURF_5]|uniref:Putative phage metallopeptidase domain-containing protein n=1 Tax=Abyssobacteria bacterium (strain SURF_5) TaxID=2093360 RepID=A0A3A4NRT8_ABYX5|nr:MAG: hypothetical protein C4520_14780 [Candidatus Abyssubacteria bacterium SURF_5]
MYNFSFHMKQLIKDISRSCRELRHIDSKKLLVAISHSRNNKKYGLQAKLVPLKFQGGRRVIRASGDWYCKMPPLKYEGEDILYVIYFCLPRFQNLDFKEKLTIVFHELYHINPMFNGDIRRFPGKFYQHTRSEKEYDQTVQTLSQNYIRTTRRKWLTNFLLYSHDELRRKYGDITGLNLRLPEPILFKRNKARAE